MVYDKKVIERLISEARFSAYLEESATPADALDLYRWNAAMASALFELVGHLEVVLRNSADSALRESLSEDERRIPWFMLKLPNVEARLESPHWSDLNVDRDTALASLTMGFWSKLIATDKLWDDLKAGFMIGCDHEELKQRTIRVGELRNTLAHHGSMLDVDVNAELDNVLSLAGLIGPDVRIWLQSLERVTEINRSRPNTVPDTVLIPAKQAWAVYNAVSAYVCQPQRAFRTVKRMAFYFQGQIMRDVPQILDRRDDVPWNPEEVIRLRSTGTSFDRQLATIIEYTLANGWTGPTQQVFILTRPSEKGRGHRVLTRPIVHGRTGAGSAFVHKQRYFHFSDLTSASTTAELPKSYFLADPLPEASDEVQEEASEG